MAVKKKNSSNSHQPELASNPFQENGQSGGIPNREYNQSNFPDPDSSVRLPRKPLSLVVRDCLSGVFRSLFTPSAQMVGGYSIAGVSLFISISGYYAIIKTVAMSMGLAGGMFFGVALLPMFLAILKTLIIQWMEIAPRRFHLFRDQADQAAFKAGREVMVNPTETSDKPSMLPNFKRLARFGDSLKNQNSNKARWFCYVYEGVGALCAIGVFLGSMNPVIQIGAIFLALVGIAGCEYGLTIGEEARENCLTAEQMRDYNVEKSRIQA